MTPEESQRFANLEKQVACIVKLQDALLDVLNISKAYQGMLLDACTIIKTEHSQLLRCIGNSGLIPDGPFRQGFLTIVSKAETEIERIEAKVRDFKNVTDKPSPPAV